LSARLTDEASGPSIPLPEASPPARATRNPPDQSLATDLTIVQFVLSMETIAAAAGLAFLVADGVETDSASF